MTKFPGIPGYKIITVLGEGGMGTVYLGIQQKLNRKVAIKVLETSLLKDPLTATRFDKEAKTAANLRHSNIVQIYDTGQAGNSHYIVMEYLEDSLKERMKLDPQGKIHPQVALGIVEEMMKALDYAHFKGIYHRDIKPANIMFRQDSTPVLVDFSIVRVFDSPDQLTRSGLIIGTPYYMSPEQANAKDDVDGRSDIYSLGAVFFEMLTGVKPYDGRSQASVIIQHIKEPVPRLPQKLIHYQPLIDRMMAKDRDKRISSGPEFIKVLDKILVNLQRFSHPSPAPPPSPPPPTGPSPVQTVPFPSHLLKKKESAKPPESPPHKPKTTQIEVTYQKPAKNKVPILNKYFNLADNKLHEFINDKLGPSFKKIKGKMASFKNYTIQKKLLLAGVPVVLVILFIVIFSLGSKSAATEAKTALQLINKLSRQLLQYQKDVTLTYQLYNKDDLESLKKAMQSINQLKEIKPTPDTGELEEKINNRIEELEREFERYLTTASEYFMQKNLAKAREYILKAKKIKTTEALSKLEKVIEQKEKPEKKKVKRGRTFTDD